VKICNTVKKTKNLRKDLEQRRIWRIQ